MLHIVPILCLILFIGFIEYRLKKHLDEIEEKMLSIESKIEELDFEQNVLIKVVSKLDSNENSSTE